MNRAATTITPRPRRKRKYHELQCTEKSDHASRSARRVLHCTGGGFHGLAVAAGPRPEYYPATGARRHSGGSRQRSFPLGTRRRHPELRLLALRSNQSELSFTCRLYFVYAAGDVVQRSERATYHSLLQPQPCAERHHTRHLAGFQRHEHRLGQFGQFGGREGGLDCLAVIKCEGHWNPSGTNGWRSIDENHLHSAIEYLRRVSALDGVSFVNRPRAPGVCALQGRLLLLQEKHRVATGIYTLAP